MRISLGRSRRIAASWSVPATAAPAKKLNAPSRWKKRSQFDSATSLRYERVDAPERHLRLLTETIAAVNSTLDLEEVLHLVATNVADAVEADACFVYLYDERSNELVLRATHGTHVDEMTRRPRMRPGEGITGFAAAERAPVMIPSQAHLDPRFKLFPNLPEDEYESILAVPILVHGERLAGALNVRTRKPRSYGEAEIDLLTAIADQVAQSIVHAQLYSEAQRRVAELEALARISEAVSESLYLEESLEAIVKTTMDAVQATGAALVLEDGRIAWPEGRAGAYAVRTPLRWKRRQIGELVADRDAPFSDDDRALLEAIAHHAAVALEHGRAVMRGVLAQEIHHRVKNNLQTVASLLRLQSRAEGVDPREALEHSVNRILAIAAVHESLTEQRDEVVELSELIDRLRAMLVQGLAVGRDVEARLEPVVLAGNRATALALVFSELLQNALEHGEGMVRIELAQHDGDVVLTIADQGPGPNGAAPGTGLSIVDALVRDELRGTLRPSTRGRDARGSSVPGLMRILVAEDESIIRLDLRDLLERAGFEVCAEARDGEEAVELARSEQPDLAIMDVKMPKLDGIEAARKILEERPDPDRDADGVRAGRARLPRGRGRRVRLSREAVPRAGSAAGDPGRAGAPRGAAGGARGGGVAGRGARGAEGDRAREGAADAEGGLVGGRGVRAAPQGEPGVRPAVEGDRGGRRRDARSRRVTDEHPNAALTRRVFARSERMRWRSRRRSRATSSGASPATRA